MSDVTLRPMMVAEYDAWYPGAVSEYAEHHVMAGSMPADKAHDMALSSLASCSLTASPRMRTTC